ncbi:T4 prohead core scaffold protein [Hyphomonas sp. TMED31]|jgi:hypothetical protein|uniref:T4 prohead core scaffold protein n=1 Tax=Hyphomonas sp. TMED31 TaxID=1986606 RepID=UPI000B764147|nr:MAG: T4 prohead core scaffold protein [Hyphomonas sp. TMED31]
MSSDNNLQEMEAGTTQSKTAVNAGAKPADPMPTMADPGTQLGSVEDLGGPTPQNYRPDDDSAKLKEPSLKTVSNVVNAKAGKADPMPKDMKEEEEVVAEAEESSEEVVSEEEATTEEVVDEYDMEEDVNALLAGEELSEEFQEKARTIFEAAINSKVAVIKEELEQQYAVAFEEEMEEVKESLAERVDSYLEYVAEEWFTENALAIEKGLQSEMTESFLSGMKDLFEAHYVTIPEDKYDAFVGMTNKLDEMETKLNEQLEKNISLNKRLSEANASGILDQISEGLAQTQKEKLASLAESVEFESETQYREKLETLKESYFTSKKESSVAKTESISEGVDSSPASITGSMDQYLRTMNSFKHS